MNSDPAGIINLTNTLKRQGLDQNVMYQGRVVDNNDPRQLGRIKVRVKHLFEEIPDEDLPWCIPNFMHCDGAFNPGGDHINRSGTFYVPKVDHTVGLKFQDGDPHRPVWCEYTVDEDNALPERVKNYPDRAVWRFSNGTFMVIDTKTNEVFINNPGDINLTVLGDVNSYIRGDQTHIVSDKYKDIDKYLRNAPDFGINRMRAHPQKQVKWKGLLRKGKGNFHTTVTGDHTFLVKGNRRSVIHGFDWLEVRLFQREYILLGHIHVSTRMDNN